MRSWLVVVIALVVLAVALVPAVGQDLLEEPVYTVHFDDPLSDVIKQLREEHGIHIDADDRLRSTRVILDLEDATEVELLNAICPQVGAVYARYSRLGSGRWRWKLRPGDWDDDPRPQAHVQDYAVYVDEVSARQVFVWGGLNQPEEEGDAVAPPHVGFGFGPGQNRGYVRSVTLGFSVMATTHFAGMALGSLRVTEAEFDTGDVWTREDDYYERRGARGSQPTHYSTRQSLGCLPDGARRIVRLRGTLRLLPSVESSTVVIVSEDVDVTKTMASSEVTLVEWQTGDEMVRVKVEMPRSESGTGGDLSLEATLVDEAGESVGKLRETGFGGGNGMSHLSWGFVDAVDQAVALRLHGYVSGGIATELAFEIEDIPLP